MAGSPARVRSHFELACLRSGRNEQVQQSMRNSVLTVLLLGVLLLAIVAPFSILAILMIIVLGSAIVWMFWTLVQAVLTPDNNRKNEKGL
jgi:fatty acid desaturase